MDVQLPSNISVEITGTHLLFKGGGTQQKLSFNPRLLRVKKSDKGLEVLPARKENRPTRAAMISLSKHVTNLLKGLETPYAKKLQVVFAHFPVTVEAKGAEVHIKNFLGEKVARKANIVGNTKVEVKGQEITVTGNNKDDVGQTAANIRTATRITKRDERVFQDGIYYAEGMR